MDSKLKNQCELYALFNRVGNCGVENLLPGKHFLCDLHNDYGPAMRSLTCPRLIFSV